MVAMAVPAFAENKAPLEVWGHMLYDVTTFPAVDDSLGISDKEVSRARQLQFGIKQDLGGGMMTSIAVDVAGGNIAVMDAYLKRKDIYAGWDLRFGHTVEPGPLTSWIPPKSMACLERASIDAFFAGMNVGFLAEKSTPHTALAVGIFRDTDRYLKGEGKTGGLSGRYTHIIGEDASSRLIHLGAWGSLRNPESVQFQAKPEVSGCEPIFETAEVPTSRTFTSGVEFAGVRGQTHFAVEYVQVDVDGDYEAEAWGYYTQVGYFFNHGKYRLYDKDKGIWQQVELEEGESALELVARFSRIDLGDFESGGELASYNLGLNWYLNSQVKIMLNATNFEAFDACGDNIGDGTALSARLQVQFSEKLYGK
ncbi:MAG: porin [archaeon]